jgi:hypothetical protein
MNEALTSSPAFLIAATVVVGAQVCSLIFLAVSLFEYRRVVRSRTALFAVMGADASARGTRGFRILAWVYGIAIVAASVLIILLFFFRPHLL